MLLSMNICGEAKVSSEQNSIFLSCQNPYVVFTRMLISDYYILLLYIDITIFAHFQIFIEN